LFDRAQSLTSGGCEGWRYAPVAARSLSRLRAGLLRLASARPGDFGRERREFAVLRPDRMLRRSSCLARCSSCGGAALPRRYVSRWGETGGLYVFEPPAGGHRYTSRAAPAEPEVVKDLAAVAQHEREIINARTSAALKRRPSREFASRSGPQERQSSLWRPGQDRSPDPRPRLLRTGVIASRPSRRASSEPRGTSFAAWFRELKRLAGYLHPRPTLLGVPIGAFFGP
jgi:hypothetical protein